MVRPKTIILSVIFLLCLAALGTAAFLYARGTPRYSLYMLKRALVAQDGGQVFRYADMDRIADAAVEKVFKDVGKPGDGPGNTAGRFDKKEFLRRALPSLKQNLQEQARAQIIAYLQDDKVREAIDGATIWAFQIRQEGGRAVVSYGNKERLAMERAEAGTYWRVVEIFWE